MPDGKKNKKNFIIFWVNNFLLEYFKVALAIFTILILLSSYFFILNPKYTKIKQDTAMANESTENVSNNLQHYLKVLNGYIREYQEVDKDIKEKIDKVVPIGNNKEDLYVLMEQIAKNENLFLTSVEINSAKDVASKNTSKKGEKNKEILTTPTELGIISIDLNFIGVSYLNLKSLLNTLEKSLQIMDVRDIIFYPESTSLVLSLDTYYLKISQ